MKPTMTTADIAQLVGVTRRHATGQIVKRPGFPAPCINASQRLRAWPTAKVLAEAGITKWDVMRFWQVNDFDLDLPNIGGTTMHGNCDLCFLKRSAIVMSLISEKPSRGVWWAAKEHSITNPNIANGGTFRSDRPRYAAMLAFSKAQADAFGHAAAEVEDGIECVGCTD